MPIGIERKQRIYYFHCFRISDCAGMEKRNGNLWVYHKLQRGDICKEHYPDVLVRCLGGDPVILFYYFFLLSSHRLKEGLENTNYEQTYEFIVLFTGEPFCIFTSYFTPICLFWVISISLIKKRNMAERKKKKNRLCRFRRNQGGRY